DPPLHTPLALLPIVEQDGPELALALAAVHHAIDVYGMHDLTAQRALEMELSPEEESRLMALPARLARIIESGSGSNDEAVYAAKALAIATKQMTAEPLQGVKITSIGAELEESPAAALLDGVWDTVELANM